MKDSLASTGASQSKRQFAIMYTVTLDSDTSTTSSRRPLVHFIWDCDLRTDFGYIVVTGMLFVGIGLCVSILIISAVQSLLSLAPQQSIALGLIIFGAIIVGLFYLAIVFRPRRNTSWNRYRLRRLDWLLERPGGKERCPHRFVELVHHGYPKQSALLKRHLKKLPPGQFIAIDFVGDEVGRAQFQSTRAFEPIRWAAKDSQLLSIVAEMPSVPARNKGWLNGARQLLQTPLDDHAEKYFRFVPLVMLFSMLAKAMSAGQSVATFFQGWESGIAVACVILSLHGFKRLAIGRQYFLIPGGLVRLENGLLFRTPRLQLFTADTASFVAYANGGVYFSTGGRVDFVETDKNMVMALLVAWLSTARTPTMQELQTLLAPEVSAKAKPAKSGDFGGAA